MKHTTTQYALSPGLGLRPSRQKATAADRLDDVEEGAFDESAAAGQANPAQPLLSTEEQKRRMLYKQAYKGGYDGARKGYANAVCDEEEERKGRDCCSTCTRCTPDDLCTLLIIIFVFGLIVSIISIIDHRNRDDSDEDYYWNEHRSHHYYERMQRIHPWGGAVYESLAAEQITPQALQAETDVSPQIAISWPDTPSMCTSVPGLFRVFDFLWNGMKVCRNGTLTLGLNDEARVNVQPVWLIAIQNASCGTCDSVDDGDGGGSHQCCTVTSSTDALHSAQVQIEAQKAGVSFRFYEIKVPDEEAAWPWAISLTMPGGTAQWTGALPSYSEVRFLTIEAFNSSAGDSPSSSSSAPALSSSPSSPSSSSSSSPQALSSSAQPPSPSSSVPAQPPSSSSSTPVNRSSSP